jgi:mycothione reductase
VSASPEVERFDLAVIGSGSGDVVVPEHFDGRRVALVEASTFGGTCVNRGCIPSKMFVHTADVASAIRQASRFGIQADFGAVDWPAIRDRILARINEVSNGGRKGRLGQEGVTLFEGRARFTGPRQLIIDDRIRLEAAQIVIAAGGRPSVPDVVEKGEVEFHTSDSIMWIDRLPASMVILGGGYVAVEFAHVFSSFGVDVTIVTPAATLLEALDAGIARRFTDIVSRRWTVHLNASVSMIHADDSDVALEFEAGGCARGEMLLVATGRQPNTEDLGL